MIHELAQHALKIINTFNSQAIANTLWSLTVLDRFDLLPNLLPICLTQFENIPLDELTLEDAQQLHQIWLARNRSFNFPAVFDQKIRLLLQRESEVTSSRFQKSVVGALDWIT